MRAVISVTALPMSIWPQAMSYCAAVERGRLGQPGDRVLGGGVGGRIRARRVGRDRAVVDDAAAAGSLRLEHAEGLLRTQKRAGEIGVDHRLPLLEGQIFEGNAGRADTGVVEQHVKPAKGRLHPGEQFRDRYRIANVGRNDKYPNPPRIHFRSNSVEWLALSARQNDRETRIAKGDRCRPANASASPVTSATLSIMRSPMNHRWKSSLPSEGYARNDGCARGGGEVVPPKDVVTIAAQAQTAVITFPSLSPSRRPGVVVTLIAKRPLPPGPLTAAATHLTPGLLS